MRFLIVGAYALGVHGRPRATGNFDVWVEPAPDNAARVMQALKHSARRSATADDSVVPASYFIGLPRLRDHVLTQLSGLTFDEAWPGRTRATTSGRSPCDVIGRDGFIKNKRATGRRGTSVTSTRSAGRPSATHR